MPKNFQRLEKMTPELPKAEKRTVSSTDTSPFRGLRIATGIATPSQPPHAAIVAARERKAVESATRHTGAVRWSVSHAK